MKQIRANLGRPVFEDEDQSRIAGFLNTIILTLGSGAVLYILIALIFSISIRASLLLIIASAVLFLIVLFILMRRGQLRLASTLLIAGLWIIQTVAVTIDGGVSSPTFVSYILIIIIASVLFGGRAGLVVSMLSAATGAGLIFAESRGLLPAPPRSTVAGWVTH